MGADTRLRAQYVASAAGPGAGGREPGVVSGLTATFTAALRPSEIGITSREARLTRRPRAPGPWPLILRPPAPAFGPGPRPLFQEISHDR